MRNYYPNQRYYYSDVFLTSFFACSELRLRNASPDSDYTLFLREFADQLLIRRFLSHGQFRRGVESGLVGFQDSDSGSYYPRLPYQTGIVLVLFLPLPSRLNRAMNRG